MVVGHRFYTKEEIRPPVTAVTESWNGTNWTEVNDLNTARRGNSAVGTSTGLL